MTLLDVRGLEKRYPTFTLDKVSFSLEPGYIMGFIGRNGAGKTTTMKAMLNLIHRDGGEVYINGKSFFENERACKADIGFVMGEFDCYKSSSLKKITDVTRRFYPEWDEEVYESYLRRFALEENKKVKELSAGMRVKYALSLALSHNARLLILDEPTSGLDPVSRDDLKGGKVLSSTDVISFRESYRLVSGDREHLEVRRPKLIGCKEHAFGFTGLIRAEDEGAFASCKIAPADLESIMIYTEQEDSHEAASL